MSTKIPLKCWPPCLLRSNFLTEAPGQYTGGMQMQGQGQMMQVIIIMMFLIHIWIFMFTYMGLMVMMMMLCRARWWVGRVCRVWWDQVSNHNPLLAFLPLTPPFFVCWCYKHPFGPILQCVSLVLSFHHLSLAFVFSLVVKPWFSPNTGLGADSELSRRPDAASRGSTADATTPTNATDAAGDGGQPARPPIQWVERSQIVELEKASQVPQQNRVLEIWFYISSTRWMWGADPSRADLPNMFFSRNFLLFQY